MCMGDVKIENTRNTSKDIISRNNKFNFIPYRDVQMFYSNKKYKNETWASAKRGGTFHET